MARRGSQKPRDINMLIINEMLSQANHTICEFEGIFWCAGLRTMHAGIARATGRHVHKAGASCARLWDKESAVLGFVLTPEAVMQR